MSTHIFVSIIIVNYKTPLLTIACIESIFENIGSYGFEVIVVDNASGDNSTNLIKQHFGNTIKLIQSSENLGFGRANNLGVQNSCGDYLFFLNSDTIVKNDPFKYFIPFYESISDVGAIGCYLLDGSGMYTLSGGKTYSARKYLKIAFNGLIRRKSPVEVPYSEYLVSADYIIGADLFIKNDLFHKVGCFNPKIFMYFEDVELCERIRDLGKVNYILPGPKIIHLVKSSSTSQFSRVYNTASLMFCLRQKMKPLHFRLFQLMYFILKSPLLLKFHNLVHEYQYLSTIYNYKKYLVH